MDNKKNLGVEWLVEVLKVHSMSWGPAVLEEMNMFVNCLKIHLVESQIVSRVKSTDMFGKWENRYIRFRVACPTSTLTPTASCNQWAGPDMGQSHEFVARSGFMAPEIRIKNQHIKLISSRDGRVVRGVASQSWKTVTHSAYPRFEFQLGHFISKNK